MKFSILFGLAPVLFLFEPCVGYTPYLGCYHDDDASPDLNAPIRITFAVGVLTVADCTQQCRESGYAYAGIRRASTCYCGNSYGRYGQADTIYCNFTCQGVSNLQFCGGVQTNSVYYSVDTADSIPRSNYAHGEVLSFNEAREKCVQTDGDLATMETFVTPNNTLTLFDQYDTLDADQREFWIGLKWQFMPDCGTAFCHEDEPAREEGCDEYYQWVVPEITGFDCTASQDADMWQAGETFVNACVTVNIDTGLWRTQSCYAQRPFLCYSSSMGDEEDEDYEEYDVVVKKDKDEQNLLSLYVILPFFILLYGGSCVLYCVHKIYRNCKHYRKSNMLLEHQEDFTEFEPDTKPMMKGGMHGPSVGAAPVPAVLIRKGKMADSRPTTSENVKVDVESDLPPYYKKTSMKEKFQRIRAEKRRDKLLENALKEARERRAKENSTLSSEESTGKTTPVAMPIHSKPPSYSRGRSSRYIKSPPAAFSPSASLMDERKSESPDDPTMMSIADIMRVKMMMKEKKKRVRKILSS